MKERRETGYVTAKAGDKAVQLVFGAGEKLAGRVVNASGQPVQVFDINGKAYDVPDGRFEIPLRAGMKEMFLVFTATGYAQYGFKAVAKGERTDLGDIRLDRGRQVSGTVRESETGEPIRGALVDIGSAAEHGSNPEVRLSEKQGAVRTDSAGRYVIPAVDTRVDIILASAEEHAPAIQPLAPDATKVDLLLPRGTVLKVTVLDAANKPLPVLASAYGASGRTVWSTQATVPTRIPALTPGKWMVRPRSSSRDVVFRTATVEITGQPEQELTIRQATDGVSLQLAVAGAEMSDLSIGLVPGRVAIPTDAQGWRSLWELDFVSVRNGKASNVLPGEYTVIVTRYAEDETNEGFAQAVRVSDQSTQTINLAPASGWQKTNWGR
jgi:hypothetical protein